MTLWSPAVRVPRRVALVFLLGSLWLGQVSAQIKDQPKPSANSDCRIEALDYKGRRMAAG